MGTGDLKKSRGLVRSGDQLGATDVFEFVKANQAEFSIATMCRMLGVSTSGYYAWAKRRPSVLQQADAVLTQRLRAFHRQSRRTYGAPRLHRDAVDDGWRVGQKRVARLMRQAGLHGVSRRKWICTTQRGRAGTASAGSC